MSACGGGYGIARSAGIVLVLFILLVIILAAAFAV
ncbi:YjcZ family sporulation protein [Chengkuizengella marina]|nr:YjcZ family sporulation protein [Chengkuizengella marina]